MIYIQYIHHVQIIRRCTSSSPAKQDQFHFLFLSTTKTHVIIQPFKAKHPPASSFVRRQDPAKTPQLRRRSAEVSVAKNVKKSAVFCAWHPPGHEEVYPGRIHIQLPNKVRTGDSFAMTLHVSLMIYFRWMFQSKLGILFSVV